MDGNLGRELLTTARRLLDISGLITAAEFYREDEHNGTDSRLGRELLYLIANDEWIRSTTEVVDASRADAVDTTIRFEIDTGLITHEAFREEPGRTSRIRLPLLVVPASARTDPLATVTITQANGDLLAPIPGADIRHQVAAALAEIVENYAVTRWAGLSDAARAGRRAPRADRDQRLVLAAVLFRLLSAPVRPQANAGGDAGDDKGAGARGDEGADDAGGRASLTATARTAELLNTPLPAEPGWVPPTASAGAGRLTRAKARLIELLEPYFTDFTDAVQHPMARSHLTVLTERAIRILGALTGTAIVVVDTDRRGSPAILSVTAPSRALIPVEPEPADGWIRDRLRRIRHAAGRLRPRAQLRIDMLLPSASADRRVQVLLPAGVAVDPDRVPDGAASVRPPLAGLRILSAPPPAAGQLDHLVREVLMETDPAIRRCLADLALARADILTETLRTYGVVPENVSRTGDAVLEIAEKQLREAQASSTGTLRQVRDALERIAAAAADDHADDHADGQADDGPVAALRAAWGDGGWVRRSLMRPTWVQTPSSRLLATRTVAVDSPAQQTAPDYARINVPVDVPDASFGSIARFSCVMSAFLMTVVFFFFLFTRVVHQQNSTPSTEVLASALTLFSVIQAGRIEVPDRSTLHGLLSAAGTVLIVFSILPTLVLAILLAFNFNGLQPTVWSGIAVVVQAGFWLLLKRGPLAAGARSDSPAARILQTADQPGYARFEVLRSQWWRETTASALVLGQRAHCYVIWEHATARRPEPSLRQVVEYSARRVRGRIGRAAGNGSDAPGTQDVPDAAGQAPAPFPPNILGLLRTSTARQALTFMVFRERPHDWPPKTANRAGLTIVPADPMEQNRLTPIEEATDPVDVYLGIETRQPGFTVLGEHPLLTALGVAADFDVLVRDVQLPVPAPLTGATRHGLVWARLRLGLPDGETTAFGPFLGELSRRLEPDPRLAELWVRSWGEAELRRVREREGQQVLGAQRPLLASEVDVVTLAPAEEQGARPWRLLAIQGAARSGIYRDILRAVAQLAPGLGLASVSCAELHGSAVILAIGHQPGGAAGHQPGAAGVGFAGALSAKVPFTGLAVPVDRWLTSADIGRQQDNPMLRVHARSTDRPGMLLDVLNALPPALAEVLPGLRGRPEASVWHALLTVGAGSATTARLTLQLPGGRDVVSGWNDSRVADIQREAMSAAIAAGADRTERAAAAGMAGLDSPSAAPENTVITVSLIRRADDPV